MHRNLLVAILTISIIGFILGIINVFNGNFSGIAWPFIFLEIFIWGDTLIIVPFFIISCVLLLKKNNSIYTGLLLSTYYLVRSFVEVIYDVSAQFSNTKRPWEAHWENLSIVATLGKSEIYVVSQLFFTVITLISLLFVVKYLKQYFRLKS